MNAIHRHRAVAALTAAGLLWGTTVPLSKLSLAWLSPGWLAFARFGLAAAILLVAARATLRAACSPAVLASGAIGYGGSVVLQNAGIGRGAGGAQRGTRGHQKDGRGETKAGEGEPAR